MYQEDITDLKWKTEQQVCKVMNTSIMHEAQLVQSKWCKYAHTDAVYKDSHIYNQKFLAQWVTKIS